MTPPPEPLGGTQACVFDAYGTLFDVGAAVGRCREALGDVADALSATWRSKQLEYSWLRSLTGDYVDFWHVTGQSLDYAMAVHGIVDPALRSRLMELYFALDAYPDAAATLRVLRERRLRTGILSNGAPSMLLSAVRRNQLENLLDAVVSVDPIRIYKPHPSVYQLAVDKMKTQADRICFVSSNYWDVSGASRFGFRVVWINRSRAPREPLPGGPEREIASLADLPALLPGNDA